MPESPDLKHGLYIHIPFCQAKCSYCHFISFPYKNAVARRYRDAVIREIEFTRIKNVCEEEADSIYFGGGTPSLVPARHIQDILDSCRGTFRVQPNCEVSIEANPGTLSREKMSAFRKYGVNRISIGAQSFVDKELSSIGRLHTSAMAVDAVSQLKRCGFENISLDLMLGLPLQTKKSWRNSLDSYFHLQIPHISIYMLDLGEKCPMAEMAANNTISLPEEDLVSDMYLETIDLLSSCGYIQYEISNFARPGFECRHNLKYWRRDPVYGFGLGSHSFDGAARYSNKPDLNDYLQTVEAGSPPTEWREPIGPDQALQESLFLGLRLAEGVDLLQLTSRFGKAAISKYVGGLDSLSERGLIKRTGNNIKLTASGMLLSNEIFQHFV